MSFFWSIFTGVLLLSGAFLKLQAQNVAEDSMMTSVPLDSIMIHELVVSGQKPPLRLIGDTLVFNVSSFFVPEGSKLRTLLKRLPGIDVSSEGRIMANGKEVVRLKLNGRELLNESTDVALNNLPSEVLYEIRLYREPTEEEQATGVVRSEGEQVLDVQTKEDTQKGLMADLSLAGGTRGRYQAVLNSSYFSPQWMNMLSATAENQNSFFGIGDSYVDKLDRTPNISDMNRQSASLVLGYTAPEWHMNGAVNLSHYKGRSRSESVTEYFFQDILSRSGAQQDSYTQGKTVNISLNLDGQKERIQWRFEPYFNYSDYYNTLWDESEEKTGSNQHISSFLYQTDGLHVVNSSRRWDVNDMNHLNAGFDARVNVDFPKRPGRNMDVSLKMDYSDQFENKTSSSDVYYSSVSDTKRQSLHKDIPVSNNHIMGQIIYTEPLCDRVKLQLSWGANYQYYKTDQTVEDMTSVFLRDASLSFPVDSLGKHAVSHGVEQTIRGLLQYEAEQWKVTAGFLLLPKHLKLNYIKKYNTTDTLQHSLDVAPELNFYYCRDNRWNLSFAYSGRSKQPDVLNLLPIWDQENQLLLYGGNPNLMSEFYHNLSCSFFAFKPEAQRQVDFQCNASFVQRALSTRTSYNAIKGVYRIMPVNVDGNWSVGGQLSFTTSFERNLRWSLDLLNKYNFYHEKGQQNIVRASNGLFWDKLTYVAHKMIGVHYLAVQYKHHMWQLKPYAFLTWEDYGNELMSGDDDVLFQYGAGALFRLDTNIGLSCGTDIYYNGNQGYANPLLNKDGVVCDFEISYSFLRNRACEIKLQGFDIFRQLKTFNIANTVSSKEEIRYKSGVNCYAMLGFTYHLGIF